MCKAIDIYNYIDGFAPFSTQMDFDNAGFLVGDPDAAVDTVLVALDITPEVMDEAKREGAQLIVSHHPVIFDPLKNLKSGSLAYLAACSGLSMICAHTNLDIADGGVNDCLANALGLRNVGKVGFDGLLRTGELKTTMSGDDFLRYVAEKLGCGGIKYTPASREVLCVAVCGGSGGDEWETAMKAGADAYVTANIKHNIFLDAKRNGFFILDAGHFCTENVVAAPLAAGISKAFPEIRTVVASDVGDPACYFKR